MFWIPGVLPAYCLVITHVFLYVALTKRDHKTYASFKLLPWEQSSLEENISIFFSLFNFSLCKRDNELLDFRDQFWKNSITITTYT